MLDFPLPEAFRNIHCAAGPERDPGDHLVVSLFLWFQFQILIWNDDLREKKKTIPKKDADAQLKI